MPADRSEYPAMLASLTPSQAVDVLDNRVRSVGKLNTDIADWLQDRRRLEEQYAAGLYKLGRRPAVQDPNELGVFSTPWSSIVNSVITLADSHRTLAEKLESDVERPLRDFHNKNREMHAMATLQGNAASMVRDIEKNQKSADKLESKGKTGGRVANVDRDLHTAQSQWESQSPYIFETLQSVDETRMNHLRDVLTQMQTHEIDQIERNRVAAEQCLNTLLTVETADEIKTFSLKTVQNKDSIPSSRPRGSVTTFPGNAGAGPSASSSSGFYGSGTGPSVLDDRASTRSDSISDLPAPKPEKLRGLKRLGTVLGRRRQSVIPAGADRISESPERQSPERRPKQNSSAFGSFSSRLGGKNKEAPSLEPPVEEGRARPRSPLRTASSINENAQSRDVVEEPTTNGTEASAPVIPNGSHQNELSGLSMQQEPLQPMSASTMAGSSAFTPEATREAATDSEGFSERPSTLDPISQAQQDAAAERNEPQYNVNIKDAPVTQDAGDATVLQSMASTLRMQAPTAAQRRAGTVRGRRDNRASVYSQAPLSFNSFNQQAPTSQQTFPEPVSEEAPVQEEAREVKSESPALFGSSTAAAVSQPPFSQSSTFSPFQATGSAAIGGIGGAAFGNAATSSSSAAPISPPLFRPGSNLADDAGSIRSGRSLSSVASGGHKHADMTTPGLNASIVETVSTWFDESGNATRAVLIGEVALAHNATDSSRASNNETIRLENFDRLEKVAPNPAFLTQTEGRSGEYSLNLSQITRTQVGFKYQVSVPSSSPGSYSPLVLQPAWKIENNQTSVIVSYTLNPEFAARGSPTVSLSGVTLILHLGETGAKAASCLSKPVGTFSKERQCIYWQLGDITISSGQTQKLLARFMTEGEAVKGRIEARWEAVGVDGSGLSVTSRGEAEEDPFQDEDSHAVAAWKEVQVHKKLVSGTYQCL